MSTKKVRRDKYISTESPIFFIETDSSNVRLDLILPEQPERPILQTINGTVSDMGGNPIKSAYVQLYDKDMKAILCTETSADGRYVITDVSVGGVYYVSATAEDKIVSDLVEVTIIKGYDETVDFRLADSIISKLSIIEGDVVSGTDINKWINGSVISLYKYIPGGRELVAITYSNKEGRYVLREVETGNYALAITALGYLPQEVDVSIIKDEEVISKDFTLQPEVATNKSTISGIIADKNKEPIQGADVILYKVDKDKKATPVALTQTNEQGFYLFPDVVIGEYRIMSNDSVIDDIEVNITEKLEISGPDAIEENQTVTMDVKYITNETTAETPLIALKSSNTEIATTNAMSVTGVKRGKVVITAYLVDKPEVFVEHELYVINLLSDKDLSTEATGVLALGDQFGNLKKTMVEGIQDRPGTDLANSPYDRQEAYFGYEFDKKYKFNTLSYQARSFGDGGWFIRNQDGSDSLKIQVHTEQGWKDAVNVSSVPAYPYAGNNDKAIYNFTFDPIVGDKIRLIGKPYRHTNALTFIATGKFSVFYKMAEGPAPIGDKITYKALEGTRTNGANVEYNLFAGTIGGPNDGTLTVEIDAPKAGIYELAFAYLSGNQRTLELTVNSESELLKPPITNGWAKESAKIYAHDVKLKEGMNIIRFSGDNGAWAPTIGDGELMFKSEIAPPEKPAVTEATVGIDDIKMFPSQTPGYPQIYKGNYVFGIMNGGYITMNAEVTVGGTYKGTLTHIGGGERIFKIDVNGVDSGVVYKAPDGGGYVEPENARKFEFEIELKAGVNELKMYCPEGVAPDFNSLKLVKKEEEQQSEPAVTEATVGIDDIKMFPSQTPGYPHVHRGNYVFGIMNGGYITMNAEVTAGGTYKGTLTHIGGGERIFKIDVNGVDSGVVYKVPNGGGYVEPANAPRFEFEIELKAGVNELKMYCPEGVAPDFNSLKLVKK